MRRFPATRSFSIHGSDAMKREAALRTHSSRGSRAGMRGASPRAQSPRSAAQGLPHRPTSILKKPTAPPTPRDEHSPRGAGGGGGSGALAIRPNTGRVRFVGDEAPHGDLHAGGKHEEGGVAAVSVWPLEAADLSQEAVTRARSPQRRADPATPPASRPASVGGNVSTHGKPWQFDDSVAATVASFTSARGLHRASGQAGFGSAAGSGSDSDSHDDSEDDTSSRSDASSVGSGAGGGGNAAGGGPGEGSKPQQLARRVSVVRKKAKKADIFAMGAAQMRLKIRGA